MKERCESDGDEGGKGKRDRARTDKLGCRWIGRAANRGYKWAKHRSVRMPRSRLQVARPPINMSAGNTTAWHTAPRRAEPEPEPRRAVPRRGPQTGYRGMATPKSRTAYHVVYTAPHLPIPLRHFVPATPLFPSLFVLSLLAHSTHFFLSLLSTFLAPSLHVLSSFLPFCPSPPFCPLSLSYRRISFLSVGRCLYLFHSPTASVPRFYTFEYYGNVDALRGRGIVLPPLPPPSDR